MDAWLNEPWYLWLILLAELEVAVALVWCLSPKRKRSPLKLTIEPTLLQETNRFLLPDENRIERRGNFLIFTGGRIRQNTRQL